MQRLPHYYSTGLILSGRLAKRDVTITVRAGYKHQAMLLRRQAERKTKGETA